MVAMTSDELYEFILQALQNYDKLKHGPFVVKSSR